MSNSSAQKSAPSGIVGRVESIRQSIVTKREQQQTAREQQQAVQEQQKLLVEVAARAAKPMYPISNRPFCVICHTLRLDPDVTGLTCGNITCINSLAEYYENQHDSRLLWQRAEAKLRETAELLGINHKEVVDVEDLAGLIHEAFSELENKIEDLADELSAPPG